MKPTRTRTHHRRHLALATLSRLAAAFFILHSAFFISRAAAQLATTGTAAATGAAAPSVNPQSALRTPQSSDDEVVTLAPFEVSAQSQTGYTANETMTGSRIPTSVMDLPFNMEFVTSDFFDDFAIIDQSDIVQGGVITSDQDGGDDGGGIQTIRGITSTGMLLNGFWMPAGIPVPTALVERSEILKGPNAGTYGQTAPGGIVNVVTKQARFNVTSTRLRMLYGSHGQMQGTVTQNLPLSQNTAALVILNANTRNFEQQWRKNTNTTAALNLIHRFKDASQLSLNFQYTNQYSKAPANRVPYFYDSGTTVPIDYTYTVPGTDQTASGSGSSRGKILGWDMDIAGTSGTGPNSWKDRNAFCFFSTYEKRINPVFSFRLGAEYSALHMQSYNTTPLTFFDANPNNITAGNPTASGGFYGLTRLRAASSTYSPPNWQKNNLDTGGLQGDLLAHYKLLNGKADCHTLFTFDFSSRYTYKETWGMPNTVSSTSANGSPSTTNAPDPVLFPWNPATIGTNGITEQYFWANYWMPVVNPLDPAAGLAAYGINTTDPAAPNYVPQYDIYHVPDFDKNKFKLSRIESTRRDVFGLMLRQQATLFNNLILYAACRFDNVTYNYKLITSLPAYSLQTHPQYAEFYNAAVAAAYAAPGKSWHSSSWTPSTGFNWKPWRWMALYGNYSTSFNPSGQTASGSTKDTYILPNERGWGYDYGIKFNLKGNLTATIGGFYINQYNMKATTEDPIQGTIVDAIGTVVSRGLEISGNWNVTQGLSFNGGYYHTNIQWMNSGYDKDKTGRSKALIPPDIITLVGKYAFQNGALKGLRVFARYQYLASSPSDDGGARSAIAMTNDVTGANVGNIIPPGWNNGLRDLKLPSYYLVNIGASYGFRLPVLGRNVRHAIQFNINNLMDKEYITTSRGLGDRRAYILSYTAQF